MAETFSRMEDSHHDALVFEAMISGVNHLLSYRRLTDYLVSADWSRAHGGFDPPDSQLLPGNLGTCALLSRDKIVMNSLFAPSHTVKGRVREYQRDEAWEGNVISSAIASLIDGETPGSTTQCWVTGLLPDSDALVLDTSIPSPHPWHQADSEWILLNVVDYILNKKLVSGVVTILLITERIPCKSCTSVIATFLKRHPEVRIILIFRYKTRGYRCNVERGFDQFRSEILDAGVRDRLEARLIVDLSEGKLTCLDQPL